MRLIRNISGIMVLASLLAFPPINATAEGVPEKLDAAISLYRTEGANPALPEFQDLNDEFSESGDLQSAAITQRYVGECYWRLTEFERARRHLDQALSEMRELGMRLEEGKTLNVLGLLEWDLGNYEQAIHLFEEASGIGKELGHKPLAGSTLNNLSLVYDELGEYEKSLKQYQRALEVYEGADFPRGVSDTLGNIGGVNLLLGRYQDALGYYQKALAISEDLQSKASMSLDHGNLGLCYLGLGRIDSAIEHFELAIELARDTGMRKEEALWQRGLGNALIQTGRYDEGLSKHRAALSTYQEIEARSLLLDALNDMGHLLLTLGDPVTAERYFQQGIDLADEIGHARAVTMNLIAIGDVRFRREQYEEADLLYSEAIRRASAAGELNYRAEASLRLSALHLKQHRFAEADAEARGALEIATEIESAYTAAAALLALAESAREQARPESALSFYESAESAQGPIPDPRIQWQTHYGRAQALIQLGDLPQAVFELEEAVRMIEGVRERLKEQRFKAGYIQDKYRVYIDLVRLQLELERIPDAFSTAERLRARSFLDQIEKSGPLSTSISERETEAALRSRVRALQRALAEESGLSSSERRQSAIDSFSSDLMIAEREYQAFIDDLHGRNRVVQVNSIPDMTSIQSLLKHNEALVEYVVGPEEVIVFILRADSLSAVRSNLSRSDLLAKINLVRELVQDTAQTNWWAPAASLSENLVGPLLQRNLLEGIDRLFLVPHNILNYLPFSLLPLGPDSGDRVLIEQFTLSYLPAAAALAKDRDRKAANQSLLAMAPKRTKLRFALEEARSITELYQPDAVLLSGPDATESAFKSKAADFWTLHLSTHGYFNAENPLLSGLELEADESNDGRLEVHEILGMQLEAGLVTLSACETGLGSGYFNDIPTGDDFVGLTRAFLLAGSHSVLAALWEVDDRSTVELMENFYTYLSKNRNMDNQAHALAQVQRSLRASVRYQHPFYWAPFILVGAPGRQAQLEI